LELAGTDGVALHQLDEAGEEVGGIVGAGGGFGVVLDAEGGEPGVAEAAATERRAVRA